ncbi:MAG: RagB/SusD family nutrient uptake outer membrane protein, partial [Flavitalea sp.]
EMKKSIYNIIMVCAGLHFASCEKTLNVIPDSEFSPANVLTSEAGLKAILISSYAAMQSPVNTRNLINISEMTTDMAFNSGGAENLYLTQFINFTWDPSIAIVQDNVWATYYRCVRDANIVLENIDASNATAASKKLFKAEARVLRAHAFNVLYTWFGPVPLRISSTGEPDLAKATDTEFNAFIEKELNEAVPDLPVPGQEEAYGRLNQGSGYSILTKFALNSKQWQKAADASQKVIAFNYYSLFASFKDLFRTTNEGNREMILIQPARAEAGYGNWFAAGALPPAFKTSSEIPEFIYTTSMANFATQYRLRTAFVNTLAANDRRRQLIITKYTNLSNVEVNLMSTADNARSLKYWDNATVGNDGGNDIPGIRYADILLSRAEALNELSGPTQAAVDNLNLVRVRAGLDALTLAGVGSKEAFRDIILRERGWEFISEGKRREDLIRHGKFITMATQRGVNAAARHVLFPIPQSEVDANKLMKQNDGY